MYDLVKQRHPGAPCALGARVRRLSDGFDRHHRPAAPGRYRPLCPLRRHLAAADVNHGISNTSPRRSRSRRSGPVNAPATIRAAEALRALARLLGIAQDTIGADTRRCLRARRERSPGLTQALRFFSDPYAAACEAFLDVEDPAGRPPRHRQHLLRHRRQLQCAEGSRGSPRLMLIVILRRLGAFRPSVVLER